MYDGYCWAIGTSFDIRNNDYIDMITEDTNFDIIKGITNSIRQASHGYKQNIIMIPVGCDFAWSDA